MDEAEKMVAAVVVANEMAVVTAEMTTTVTAARLEL